MGQLMGASAMDEGIVVVGLWHCFSVIAVSVLYEASGRYPEQLKRL